MRRAPLILGAMILALVPAAGSRPAAASDAATPALEVPAVVTAGQAVTLRWSRLPAGAEEVEIVLSLDGGRSYHVRVSPELEAREGGFLWRVPDLPAPRARLMLRMGGEEGERTGALSREFRIVHAEGAPSPELGFHEGQFWTGLEPPAAAAGLRVAGDGPRFEDVADEAPCAPTEPMVQAAPAAPARLPQADAPSTPVRRDRSTGSAPREVPLRI